MIDELRTLIARLERLEDNQLDWRIDEIRPGRCHIIEGMPFMAIATRLTEFKLQIIIRGEEAQTIDVDSEEVKRRLMIERQSEQYD